MMTRPLLLRFARAIPVAPAVELRSRDGRALEQERAGAACVDRLAITSGCAMDTKITKVRSETTDDD